MVQAVYTPEDRFWSGYAGESRSGLQFLAHHAQSMPYGLSNAGGKIPEVHDPRQHKLFSKGFMRVENQGGVGACKIAGHLITMEDGSLKPIEDIAYGDRVLTH